METVFRFNPAMTALPFVGAVVVLYLLRWLSRRMWKVFRFSSYTVVYGPAWLLVTLLFLIVEGMSMAAARVVVTPESVFEYTGLPWHQNLQGFRLRNLDSVHISHDARGEVWTAIYRRGTTVQIRPGSIWAANSREIKRHLEEHSVMFSAE